MMERTGYYSAKAIAGRERQKNPVEPGSVCTGRRHGKGKAAWDRGCRCPSAVAAHEAFKARPKIRRAMVDADGNCIAGRHGTVTAYREAGCRCPETIAANEARLVARHAREKAAREADPAYDPRAPWRGPDLQVSPFTLMMLLEGVMNTATRGEYVAAVAILDDRLNRWGRPVLGIGDVADRLRINPDKVRRCRMYRRLARAERTERRLADVKWKAKRR